MLNKKRNEFQVDRIIKNIVILRYNNICSDKILKIVNNSINYLKKACNGKNKYNYDLNKLETITLNWLERTKSSSWIYFHGAVEMYNNIKKELKNAR